MAIATLFLDIDGTVVDRHNQPIPGAVAAVKKLKERGFFIIITTFRGPANWADDDKFGVSESLKLFAEIGLPSDHIVWNCPSPRIVVNDDDCFAHRRVPNAEWTDEEVTHLRRLSWGEE
jgi:histidinol phosphatase-like enzyme